MIIELLDKYHVDEFDDLLIQIINHMKEQKETRFLKPPIDTIKIINLFKDNIIYISYKELLIPIKFIINDIY